MGLTAPVGLLTALPARAQTAPVTVGGLAEACGVVLSADAPREVLLAVTSVPLDVVLARAPEEATEPESGAEPSPSATAEPTPVPTTEPTAMPSPSPDPDPTTAPEEPAPLPIGPEPLAVALLPAAGAGTDDAYRVVLTDPATLEPLLEVELPLPLCAVVEPPPSPSPTASPTPSAEPSGPPSAEAPAEPPAAAPAVLPGPAAPAAPTTTSAAGDPVAAGPVAARSTSPRTVTARSIGRLAAALRAASRPGLPDVASAPALPELAPELEAATGPTPVIAYPPGTTGVRLAAPPDRPLAVLLPLQLNAAPARPAPAPVLLARGGPPAGLVDALPPALLAAAAGAGFLATQLRRRVPLRR